MSIFSSSLAEELWNKELCKSSAWISWKKRSCFSTESLQQHQVEDPSLQIFIAVYLALVSCSLSRIVEFPAVMPNKMKGIYKSFKYISKIFAVKDRDMEIGYPTDVKHVAHIGWEVQSGSAPSWMSDFKAAPDFTSPIGNTVGSSPWSSQDFEQHIGQQPISEMFKDIPPTSLPKVPKKQKLKKNSSTNSAKSSSTRSLRAAKTKSTYSEMEAPNIQV